MSIIIENLTHIYNEGMPFASKALDDISLNIEDGDFVGLIGHTGSGKSTLIQHLNGILKPSSGKILINNFDITAKDLNLTDIRKKVGVVFQYPEYQLFEETIAKDVSFGPKNFGVSEEDAYLRAKEIIKIVGMDESYLEKSPFDLSGGQKRRVAIAGILAMDPNVLVLDEPTAGLDPQGAQDMMALFVRMNKEFKKTVLIVTHDMEHVLHYCDEVIVMKDGKVKTKCDVQSFFEDVSILKELEINPPAVIRLREELIKNGFHIDTKILDIDELAAAVEKEVNPHE
ncbi:MAG: energy-coupling factor transporter ATPase [Longicatena sp.]